MMELCFGDRLNKENRLELIFNVSSRFKGGSRRFHLHRNTARYVLQIDILPCCIKEIDGTIVRNQRKRIYFLNKIN